jgi:hypothetical protein
MDKINNMGKINNKGRKVQVGGYGEALKRGAGFLKDMAGTAKTPLKAFVPVLGGVKSGLGKLKNLRHPVNAATSAATKDGPMKWTPTKSPFDKAEIWEALWEEPCWIHPDDGSFSVSKIGEIWCTWSEDNNAIIKAAKEIAKPKEYEVDKIGLQAYLTPNNADGTPVVTSSAGSNTAKRSVASFLGDIDELEQIGKTSEINLETLANSISNIEGLKGLQTQLVEEKKISYIDLSEFIREKDLSDPQGDDAVKMKSIDGKCEWTKWHFCFWFKFILGPAGYLILKMAPHFIKFFYATTNIILKIFLSIWNTLPASQLNPVAFPYKNKKGDDMWDWKPHLGDLFLTYIGTVFPFQFFKFDWGQKYGKGEFGKFIVGLIMVSIALITIGGIGITMLILAFSFYCIKVMGMFSDNIQEKTKK